MAEERDAFSTGRGYTCSQNKVAVPLSPFSKNKWEQDKVLARETELWSPPPRPEAETCWERRPHFQSSSCDKWCWRGCPLIRPSYAFVLEVAANENRRLGLAISFLTGGGLKNTASLRMASRYAERKRERSSLTRRAERVPCKLASLGQTLNPVWHLNEAVLAAEAWGGLR